MIDSNEPDIEFDADCIICGELLCPLNPNPDYCEKCEYENPILNGVDPQEYSIEQQRFIKGEQTCQNTQPTLQKK